MARSKDLAILAALVLTPTSGFAGPWTKSLGEAYVKVAGSIFSSDTYVDPTGFVQAGVDHTSLTASLYAEVGLADHFALNLYLPHVTGRNRYTNGDRYASLGTGDASLGLAWSSPWLAFPHAVRGAIKLPLYDLGSVAGFEAKRFPARGDGQVDLTLAISAGDSFRALGIDGYGYLEAGHVARTEWFFGADLGRTLLDGFTASGQLGVSPLDRLTVAISAQGIAPYSSDQLTKAYLAVGGAAFVRIIDALSVEAAFDAIVLARNSSLGTSLSLGFSTSI
ncbi:MAG: hypothetical protein HYV07_01800 [Deltaproteobacteria bacterium]|nr:hypothetical protein [Deltaproteobacteria bacterium]